jgi:hypothetical protein
MLRILTRPASLPRTRPSRPSGAWSYLEAARGWRPFWTLVGIRLAFLLGTALTLLWQRPEAAAVDRDLRFDEFHAYDGRTDLLFNVFTQWDAGWYLNIAAHGYGGEQAAAFFPLYPLVVAAVGWVTRSLVVAGVLVSLVAAGIAAELLWRIARELLGERAARDSVLYLATWPVAYVFTSVYAEALFVALAAGSVLAALRRRSLLAAGLATLAVATRLIGLALLPALVVLLWPHLRRLAPLVLVPVPVVLFAWHLERRLGDWQDFYESQSAFWLRHTPMLGPLGGLWDAFWEAKNGALQVLLHLPRYGAIGENDMFGTRNALHFLLLLACIWLTWVAWTRLGPAFGLYSVAYLAIVLSSPVEFFPLVSLPRFVLGDFPLFLALAAVLEERPTARSLVLYTFVAVGAAAAVGFSRHAWIA